MLNIMRKEFKLSAHILSYLFIGFGLMFFIPGYPILCGVFFVTLGIFQSFQNVRENNDILFSVLLPVAKCDVVKGKYLFVCFIELCALLLMAAAVSIRMTVLADSPVYRSNAMMNANGFALGVAFLLFGLYNTVFVGGFLKTSYRFGRQFVFHIVLTFLIIGIAETLHHIPGLECLNAFGTDCLKLHILLLIAGIICFGVLTHISCRVSCERFEKTDL